VKITKEMLEAKREELLVRRDELIGQANSVNGALENIEYWLDVLHQSAEEPSTQVPSDGFIERPAFSPPGFTVLGVEDD